MQDKKTKNARSKILRGIDSIKNSSVGVFLSPISIEMKSNREAVIEGCKSISQYDENFIKINMHKMAISFFGRDLQIKYLTSDSLVIRGFITSIEFMT